MKKTLISLILISLSVISFTQKQVALQSNGVTSIFGGVDPFIDAYNTSIDGDTIYLPGGVLSFPTTINKRLTIYGAGHYPDSTTETAKTVLSGSLTISQGADSLHLEGIEIVATLLTTNNHKIDHLTITRCKIGNVYIYGDQTTPCEYLTIKESVINGYLHLDNATLGIISNNIVSSQVYTTNNFAFYNNIFLYSATSSYYVFNDIDNCTINNNIFLKSNSNILHSNCISNTLYNNLFTTTINSPLNTLTNNYYNVDMSTLFINQTGYLFSYSFDYHLNSPGSYPGTDATQAGIYGGVFPCKLSSVPQNPHISYKNVAPATNPSGFLNIHFKVNAQQE